MFHLADGQSRRNDSETVALVAIWKTQCIKIDLKESSVLYTAISYGFTITGDNMQGRKKQKKDKSSLKI